MLKNGGLRMFAKSGRGWMVGLAMTGALLGAAVAFALTVAPTPVARVSVAYDGGLANLESSAIACSADGRYVAFTTGSSNIIEGDANGRYDAFRRDLVSGETTLVSVSMEGTFTVWGVSNQLDMTPDGRYVVFVSPSDGLVPGEMNLMWNVYRRDMVSGDTTLVSSTIAGVPAGGTDPTISDDGRFVVFMTDSTALFPGDANGVYDCILKDLVTGATSNVTYTHNGSLSNGHSFYPCISGNGRKVAFASNSTNMLPDEVSNRVTLFVRDLDAGTLKRVDEKLAGGESAGEAEMWKCALDYTGRYIAFASRGKDLVADPVGPNQQVYLRDTVSNETTYVPVAPDGGPAELHTFRPDITDDGRYVAFASRSANLVDGDMNAVDDVFWRDMETGVIEMLTFNENGEQLDTYTAEHAISASGTAVAISTPAENILPPFSGIGTQVYRRMLKAAEPEPIVTALRITSPSKTLSKYGEAYSLAGSLEASGAPVAGRRIVLQAAPSATATFTDTSVAATTGAGGGFTLKHVPRDKTYFRARFAGDDEYAPATSSARYATPRVSMGTPVAPGTMYAGRSKTVYGYLRPRHTSGTYPVRIYRYRYVGGKWKSYGYTKAKVANYSTWSKYSAKVKLSYKGRWRLRAYAPADSKHAATWSAKYDYVTVK